MSSRWALATDVGRVREKNEDSALALPERGLFVIADGMGGHVAGEVASRVAVETVVSVFSEQRRPRRIRDEQPILRRAILAANEAVLREANSSQRLGMGTTLTAVAVRSRTVTVAHVGDSRACFVRPSKLVPITTDHTMVAMLVASGAIPADAADEHPERHLLTQALGTQTTLEPELRQARIPRAARILLSTDGLHDHVPEDEILALADQRDLDEAVHALLDAANARGGEDNITVILIDP